MGEICKVKGKRESWEERQTFRAVCTRRTVADIRSFTGDVVGGGLPDERRLGRVLAGF